MVPHVLVDPQYLHPCEAGGVIRCGLQTRLDMGPHAIPRGCQLSSQSCNGGSLEAQLSDRPADRPGAQTRPGSTHRVVLLNESHDPAGAFAAHPASFKPPDAHREPGPGRVDHLHHHTPVTLSDSAHSLGSQHSGHRTLCRASDRTHVERRQSDGSPPNRPADHADHNDQATRSSNRWDETPPGSLTTAGVEVRSSPGTSTSTPNPRPTPAHPHSTRKSPRRRECCQQEHLKRSQGPEAFASGPSPIVGPTGLEPMTFWV